MEAVLDSHARAKMRFFVCAPNHAFPGSSAQWFPPGNLPPQLPLDTDNQAWTELYENIATEVDGIQASYLAPALHFNNYLESLAIDIEMEETKHDLAEDAPRPCNTLRRLSVDAYATSVLLAIKSGLDRLVRILSFYYPGIARHTTWGRFDKKGKPSGFMTVVERGMLNEQFLANLNAAHLRWIQQAVGPRDALIHYQDAISIWCFLPKSGALIQSHEVADADGQVHSYGINVLTSYVDEWYQLADSVLLTLATRLPKVRPTSRSSGTPSAAAEQ